MGNVDPVLNWQLWIRGGTGEVQEPNQGEVQERLRNHQPKQLGPSCLLFVFGIWYFV